MTTLLNKALFNVLLRRIKPSWRGIFEGTGTLLGLLSKATLVVLNGQTKESCIAAYLFAKKVLALRLRSGLLFVALYLSSSFLQKAYGGDPTTGLLPVPVALTRQGYRTIIPSFHRRMIYRKDDKADQLVQLSLSWFSLAKLIPLAPPISKGTLESLVSPLSPDPDGLIETFKLEQ